jgi:hypothetical protein
MLIHRSQGELDSLYGDIYLCEEAYLYKVQSVVVKLKKFMCPPVLSLQNPDPLVRDPDSSIKQK